jgi:hypothetical protein
LDVHGVFSSLMMVFGLSFPLTQHRRRRVQVPPAVSFSDCELENAETGDGPMALASLPPSGGLAIARARSRSWHRFRAGTF